MSESSRDCLLHTIINHSSDFQEMWKHCCLLENIDIYQNYTKNINDYYSITLELHLSSLPTILTWQKASYRSLWQECPHNS